MADTKTPDIPDQFSWGKEFERVTWFREDLEKGGWQTVKSVPGAAYYIKYFADDQCPVKVLIEWELPISASVASKVYWNFAERGNWDPIFKPEVLETTEEGSKVVALPLEMPWPLWSREFLVVYRMREFSNNSFLLSLRDTTHPSKPKRSSVVQIINGGNFDYITPDERNPQESCKVFSLSTNDYGGWLPKSSTWFWGRRVPPAFEKSRQGFLKAIAENQFDNY